MVPMIALAFLAGILVSVSRSLNGRLAQSSSAMWSSLVNHVVGFAFLSAVALTFGGLMPEGVPQAPPTAWAGGTLGVIFVAAGSYLIARIGAVATAMLVIAGQMVSGVALDLAFGRGDGLAFKAAGVALILAGMWLSATRRR